MSRESVSIDAGSRAATGSRRGRGARAARVGRFRVPVDDVPVWRYFRHHLQVSHNVRERLARCLPTWLVRRTRGRKPVGPAATSGRTGEGNAPGRKPPAPIASADEGGLEALLGPCVGRLLRESGLGRPGSVRWIVRRRGEESTCQEWLLFLFGRGAAAPAAIVRVRHDGDPAGALEREWQALRGLRAELDDDLATTLPEPLAYVRRAGIVALSLGPVAGRSAYVDLYSGLTPRCHVRRHMEAAAGWLGDFHRARRVHGSRILGEVVDAAGAAAELEVPLVDAHGDFWAGNLLLDGPRPAVVDWSRHRPASLPSGDLFQFPLSYAFHFPMSRYRRVPPENAFRRAFLEDTWMSRQVRRYLAIYCRRGDLEPRLLAPLLHHELSRRACPADTAPAPPRASGPGSGQEGVPWKRLSELLARADRSVLSA